MIGIFCIAILLIFSISNVESIDDMKPFRPYDKFTIHPRSSRQSGFTLTEVLIVITIIVVIASLMFSLIGHMRNKAHAVDCLNRIKQCGLIVLGKAADNNNILKIHVSGTSSDMHDFRLYGMVNESVGSHTVEKVVRTPAHEGKDGGTWLVWAVNRDSDPSTGVIWERFWVERGGQQRYLEGLRLARCSSPESYPLLADSSNEQGVPRTGFGNSQPYKFAMRYGRKGPIFFLDGAARMVGRDEMASYGITRGYVFKGNPAKNPTPVTATAD
jgi:prepilin-type N-terminal cleavage/methylation domain-containing protein